MDRALRLWLLLLIVTATATQAQSFTATWPLLNPPLQAGTASGAVTVADELVNGGNTPSLTIVGYNSFGQQVNQGSNAWVAGVDYTRYLEFTVDALPGNVLTVNQVDFEYGWDSSFGILIKAEVWISWDDWQNQQQLGTTALYQQQALAAFTSSSTGPTAASYSVRIYPYSTMNTGANQPIYATHRNVVISGTTMPARPSISGFKFEDIDGDGTWDDGEPPMGGVTITLTSANPMTPTQSVTTAADGSYSFSGLAAGTYTLSETSPGGYVQTAPAALTHTVTIGQGETLTGYDFGNMLESVPECVAPPDGMVGWWTGDSTAQDRSGNGNHGAFPGAYLSPGKVADAFVTGAGSTVSVPDSPSLNFGPNQDFSLDFWMQAENPGGFYNILSKQSPTDIMQGYRMFLGSGSLTFQAPTAGATPAVTGSYPQDTDWHFVAVTWDRDAANGLKLFIDNQQVGVGNYPALASSDFSNTSALVLGGWSPNPDSNPFIGRLDEVELFNRALTSDNLVANGEVGDIFRAGALGKCKEPLPGTIEGHKFEDIDGDGTWDEGEPPMGDVTITLTSANPMTPTQSVTTAADGSYSFSGLAAGTYTVAETSPGGYVQTAPAAPAPPSYTVTIEQGETLTGYNFGNQSVSIGVCVAPPPDMVGWWSGDATAQDRSGNGNHGSFPGAYLSPGKVADAFVTGAGSTVSVPDSPSLNFGPNQDFSLDFWMQAENPGGFYNILSKQSPTDPMQGYRMFLASGSLTFQAPTAGATPVVVGAYPQDTDWHFVAVTWDRDAANGLKLFIDNQQVGVGNYPALASSDFSNTSALVLGGWSPNPDSNPFIGRLDEVELFNRALTSDNLVANGEVGDIYRAGAAGKCIDGVGGACDIEVTSLTVNTGLDHTTSTEYASGGTDAFWTIVSENPAGATSPRPAEVLIDAWGPSGTSDAWIGPSQYVMGPGQNYHPAEVTYALEFCIVGDPASQLEFNLLALADDLAAVWLEDPQGNLTLLGNVTASNSFYTVTAINTTVLGPFVAGTYRLLIRVTNLEGPTGAHLTGTVTGSSLFLQQHVCCNNSGKINGTKFLDEDADGEYDLGEPGMQGVTIILSKDGEDFPLTTDSLGGYYFEGEPGTYTVSEVSPDGYTQTYPAGGSYEVTVGAGGIVPNLDFGNKLDPEPTPGTIEGHKFEDIDGDGTWDDGEPPMGDVLITLTPSNPAHLSQTVTTAADGSYSFSDLTAGTYTVSETSPGGYVQTAPAALTHTVTIGEGESLTGYDFGNMLESVPECVPRPGGMIGWWTGDGTADDLTGNGHDGTFTGSYSTGKVAASFQFATDTDGVTIPDAPSLNFGPGENLSLDFWLYADDPSVDQMIIQKLGSAGTGYLVSFQGGNLMFTGYTITGGSGIVAAYPQGAGWHFVAITYERASITGLKVYIDGLEVASSDPTVSQNQSMTNGDPLLLGGATALFAAFTPFSGRLDEVELFNEVLTAEQVFGIYQAGAGGKCKETLPGRTSIQGYKFEDINGDGDWDAGENGLGGITLQLFDAGTLIDTAVSTSDGSYSFTDVAAGTYTLGEASQGGYVQTAPSALTYTITIAEGETLTGFNFGNMREGTSEECEFGIEPPPGMVLWLPADDHAGDLSGYMNDGTLQGAAGYAAGKVAKGFALAGPSDYVRVADDPSLDFGPNEHFSFDMWFKTSTRESVVNLLIKKVTGTSPGYALALHNGRLNLHLMDANGFANFTSSGPALDDGVPHFVAVSVTRSSTNGILMYIDGTAEYFDPTPVAGNLSNTADLLVGYTQFAVSGFGGVIDELEIFDRPLRGGEFRDIFEAGKDGKCKVDVPGNPCAVKVTELTINTGFDHTAGSVYAIGGNDAFWTMTGDPLGDSPMPADVIMPAPSPAPGWSAALSGSQWIGPFQIVPDANSSTGFSQGDVGLAGYPPNGSTNPLPRYTYTLEFCVVGEVPATSLVFDLSIQVDDEATVWLVDPTGFRVAQIGGTITGTGTIIAFAVIGPFPAGTYRLEVDVANTAIPPDFSGLNLVGTITGENLFMQNHDCCNSDGKLTGTKYLDENGNGEYGGELGMGNVTIVITDTEAPFQTWSVITNSSGNWYKEVPPGTYTITELPVDGYTQTGPPGGSHTVTVGPGGIAHNLDFGNQPVPCLSATAGWACGPTGAYVQLTVTNNTGVPVHGISLTSLTNGVAATVIGMSPGSPYPLAVGAQLVLSVRFTGLGIGASAVLSVNMSGAADEFGISESCCRQEVTVTRPAFYCPKSVGGSVLVSDPMLGDIPGSGWKVRARSSDSTVLDTMTDLTGEFLFESLTNGDWEFSVFRQFGYLRVEPEGGFHLVRIDDRTELITLRFVMGPDASASALDRLGDDVPDVFSLEANYPNPFNPTTRIRYDLPESGPVRLEVFDMLGRPVSRLIDFDQAAGTYEVVFDATDLPSGLYIYRLTAAESVATRKMVLMK